MAKSVPDIAATNFERLFGPEFGHNKPFDLNAIRAALTALGEPHTRLPPIFHVAGTNGKGSTIAFMRAIAEAADLSVHAFTKPHLFKLNERFTLAGATADDAALIAAAERVHAAAPQLTQFDAQIAAALLLFSETPADLTLIETGMGGRSDSTNILTPALSILTPIGLDHQDALGATLADIAAHKAGILKPKCWAITAQQPPEALAIIEGEAERIGAPLWRQGVEWDAYANSGRLVVQTEQRTLDLPLPALIGAHQIQNAGLAAAAFLTPTPFDIPNDAFAAGMRAVRWPGRLQPLTSGARAAPVLAAGGEVWVDGGHNAHAAQALAHALTELQRKRAAPTVLIVGMRARKDASTFIATLSPSAQRIIAVPVSEDHIAPTALADLASKASVDAFAAPSLTAAMQNAAQLPAPRVLICGSLLLAAEALRA